MSFKSYAESKLPKHSCSIVEKFWTEDTIFILKNNPSQKYTVAAMDSSLVRARENHMVFRKSDCRILRS